MESSGATWPGQVIRSVRSAADLRGSALLVAASAPLWWLPGGFSRFVVVKLLVTAVAVLLAALARPVGALPRPVVLAGALWAGCFTLAALAGDTPLASLLGRWPRYEGLPTLGLYAASCWAGARVVSRDAVGARRLEIAVGSLALVLAAFSVLDVLGVSPLGPSTEARTGSVLGNATDQGAVAMMAALVLAGPALGRARGSVPSTPARAFTILALVAAIATVALSGSRTALALTLVGLVGQVVLSLLHAHPLRNGLGAARPAARGLGAVVVLAAVALVVPTTRERLLGLGTAEGRLQQWRLSLDLVVDHPLLGLGGSRYVDAFLSYEDAAFVDFTGPQRLADSPHSILLQVLVAGGVVLLAATLLGAYAVARRVREVVAERPAARPVALAVAAYLALACVNFTTAGPTCLAALLLGALIAVPRPSAEPVRPHVPIAAVSGALVLVLGAAVVGDLALQRGVDAADARVIPRAEDAFAQATRWRPWDVDAAVIAARILAEDAALGETDAAAPAERLARDALSGLPESYEALVALGVSLSAQGRLAEATDVLDRAVALASERPDGFVQRAIARAGLGQVDAAKVDLRRAREILPDSPVVRRLMRQVDAPARRSRG